MSDEIIKPPTTSDNSLAPALSCIGHKVRVKFTGSCLKQDKIIFTHIIVVVNIYIFYILSVSTRGYVDYPTLENCLFGAAELTQSFDIHKYKYAGYGIGFDRRGTFLFRSGFGCYVISFRDIDNKKKKFLANAIHKD